MESNKSGFVFQPSYYEAINAIQDKEQKLEMYEAIINYGINGIEPTFTNPLLEALFKMAVPTLNASKKRYKASVENGKKGGRPPKTKNDTPNKSSNNTSSKSNINTPEVKKEVVIEEEEKKADKLKQYQENGEEMKNRYQKYNNHPPVVPNRLSKLMH